MAKKASTTTAKVAKRTVKKSEVSAAAPIVKSKPAAKAAAKKTTTRKRVAKPKPQPEATNGAPAYEDIARLAYQLWESRGRPEGSSQEDWYRAELELSR